MTNESKGKQRGAKTGRATADDARGKPDNDTTAQKRLQEIKETSQTRGNR
jgi:hypothetical protein